MIKTILIVIVVLIAAVLAFAATRPDGFQVERSIAIKAPPEKIYPFLNEFQRWALWSPWEKMDPAMKRSYSGPLAGKGAVYGWEGNKQVGKGRMEITEASPTSKLVIQLDFLSPFEAHNVAEFTLQPQGDTTTVRWVMRGPTPYLMKVMHLFMNMDKLVGKDFEAGLANLKALAEA